MKYAQLIERVASMCDGGCGDPVNHIARLTIETLGFHVAADGEIRDPRPAQPTAPQSQHARWSGGRRRR